MNKYRFPDYFAEARVAGMEAGNSVTPTPMVVTGANKQWFVPDGVCGFAWVNVRPGNSKFANWLKKEKLGRSSYHGGVDVWVSEFGQSMTRKEAFAGAFAKVLREKGVNAYADSRMD